MPTHYESSGKRKKDPSKDTAGVGERSRLEQALFEAAQKIMPEQSGTDVTKKAEDAVKGKRRY